MTTGELLTKLTIWIALAGYTLSLATMLVRREATARQSLARAAWTVGCAFLLLHITAAFHFYHDWSHAAALAQTAAETGAVVGIDWGGGIWFNYLLLIVWIGDTVWWWSAAESYRQRPRWVSVAVHGYFAFMIFNAAVVFEDGLLRWLGLVVTMGLVGCWVRRR